MTQSDDGMGLLEIVVSISVVMIFFGVTVPIWSNMYRQMTAIQTQIRHRCHLNWLSDRICDDIQFSGHPTLSGSTLTITGASIITYHQNGQTLRRQIGGSAQTLSTFPIIGWQVTALPDAIRFSIHTSAASVDRTCSPW